MTSNGQVPHFGTGYKPPPRMQFQLSAYDPVTNDEHVFDFNARKAVSGGAFMLIALADGQMEQMKAFARIIFEAADDTDGLPTSYRPTDTDGSPIDPDTIPEQFRNDPDCPVDPRWWDRERWSSARRLATLLERQWDNLRIPLEGVTEMAEWMLEEAAERPTWKPLRSSHGQEPTATTSEETSSSPESMPT